MNFIADDNAEQIAAVAERFLRDCVAAAPGGRVTPNDPMIWSRMAEMGWLALGLSEECGGLNAAPTVLGVICRAFGKAGIVQPYVSNAALPLLLLDDLKDPAAVKLASAIAAGKKRAAIIRSKDICVKFSGDSYILNGKAPLVAGGNLADFFLIPSDDNEKINLFLFERKTVGVTSTKVETIDGSDFADIEFHNVSIERPVIATSELRQRIAWIDDLGTVLMCSESVGVMETLIADTSAHTKTRQQFGRPLRSFQSIEHGIADMQVAFTEASAITLMAYARLKSESWQRDRSICAAKIIVSAAGRQIAHHAIQFHGAMGVTDELNIGIYAKRLLGIACTVLEESLALHHYIENFRSGRCWSYLGQPDFIGSIFPSRNHENFRAEIANWLDQNLSEEIVLAQKLTTTVYAKADVALKWQNILEKKGWAAPHWPSEFGGTGWSNIERYIWSHESARRSAPIISPIGMSLVGPVLFQFGTAEQQARFLPAIISGQELWCQGFSEPSAGSDLASLSTRATRDDDDYIVNGTKIWTTQGHEAQMMAALVRTSHSVSRREGISFLMIDMRSSGIEIRPINTVGGDHELNQIFFDNVRVPAANLIGEEGQGWEIAKFLLKYERGGDVMSAALRALLKDITLFADRQDNEDTSVWAQLARAAVTIDTLEALELLAMSGSTSQAATPSILKLRASETQQQVTELGVKILGADAIRWISRRPLHSCLDTSVEDSFVSRYFNSRANTIFGGSREIQKTLIANTVQ